MVSKSTLPALRQRAVAVALGLVLGEVQRAVAKFPPFNSGHEGYAVILEELDELFDEVRADAPGPASIEAMQVAAMGVRYMTDLDVGKILAQHQPIGASPWRTVRLEDVGQPGPWLVATEGGEALGYCDVLGSTPDGIAGYVNAPDLTAGSKAVFWNVAMVAPVNRPGLTNFD